MLGATGIGMGGVAVAVWLAEDWDWTNGRQPAAIKAASISAFVT
jgi:hypothetical protein